ncbi:MAG: DnaA regulatory inactivator Hda [Gammaproteobacteria bacterium]
MQLPLSIGLRDGASFANYFAGPNREAVQTLHDIADAKQQFVYIGGAPGTGKTHLLQAACQKIAAAGATPAYLPLSQADEVSPEVLAGLEQLALVCIDDIQAIAARPEWEAALFHLYNRIRETATPLIISGNAAPRALGLKLADLSSRLSWGLVLQLHALNDEEKIAALSLRARGRGIELPDDVARFLLRRCPRDMPGLFELLQRLDLASLAAQRRLTIPFVRDLIK